METTRAHQQATTPVAFTLNGSAVAGRAGETIIETASRYGVEILLLVLLGSEL